MAKVRSREKLRGDDQASTQILAEQREPLIKVSYASKDGQVKELVHRRPPPNRFAMSEQDVDDVAFLTGEISYPSGRLEIRMRLRAFDDLFDTIRVCYT